MDPFEYDDRRPTCSRIRNRPRTICPNLISKQLISPERLDRRFIRDDGRIRTLEDEPAYGALMIDPIALNSYNTVYYSLDKCYRWLNVERFRTEIDQFQNESIGLIVSALEVIRRPFDPSNVIRSRIEARAYHAVENGSMIHRMAKHYTSNATSLINKQSVIGKKRKRRQQQQLIEHEEETMNEVIAQSPPPIWARPAHIRYIVVTEHESKRVANAPDKLKRCYRTYSRPRHHPKRCSKQYEFDCDIDEQIDSFEYDAEDDDGTELDEDIINEPLINHMVPVEQLLIVKPSISKSRMKTTCNKMIDNTDIYDNRQWIEYMPSESTVVIDDNNTNDESRNIINFHPLDYIQLSLLSSDVCPNHLRDIFGDDRYYECQTCPRRFIIDISDRVMQLISTLNNDINQSIRMRKIDVRMIFVSSDNDDGQYIQLRFAINASFDDIMNHKCILDKVILYSQHYRIDQLIDVICEIIGTMPIESFVQNQQHMINRSTMMIKRHDTNQLHIQSTQSLCLDVDEAMCLALKQSSSQQQLDDDNIDESFELINDQYCQVCYSQDEDGFSLLNCQHYFCNECWFTYVCMCIETNRIPIQCMLTKCSSTVDYRLISTLVPFKLYDIYINRLIDEYRSNWINCNKCKRIFVVDNCQHISCNELICLCGHRQCAICHQSSHFPASCNDYAIYLKMLAEYGDDKRILFNDPTLSFTVKVKQCPYCNNLIEKKHGCSHIVCRCGNNFCWDCSGKYNDINRHTNCFKQSDMTFIHIELRDVRKRSISMAHRLRQCVYDCAVEHRFAIGDVERRRLSKRLRNNYGRQRQHFNQWITTLIEIHHLIECSLIYAYFDGRKRTIAIAYINRLQFLLVRCNQIIDYCDDQRLESIFDRIVSTANKLIEYVQMNN